MKKGQFYYVDFCGNKGSEINEIHLAILFNLPSVKNMLFCIPLTSPKEKHFKSKVAFENRNHNELKYQNLIYIDQTDSIALLDQMRTISIKRLLHEFIKDNEITILNEKNIRLLKVKLNKIFKIIFE